ncbi:MAG: histidinol-phosphatase [Spirochaetia bacterium]|jgi:predicted ATPase|nr:histidinol-phosphatase [Spirochaetia bacterium]
MLNIFQNGSRWLKADFHLHTISDSEFSYSKHENKDFVSDYIAKLKEQQIYVGVITNHNKFNSTEFSVLSSEAEKEGIFLLPGVELSVHEGAGGLHVLVVFDEPWLQGNCIGTALSTIFSGKIPDDYEDQNGYADKSLKETTKILDEFHHDYFYIFAHVNQKSGLFEELDIGRIKDLFNNPNIAKRILGFQKVEVQQKKDNLIQEIGKQNYPAEVEGSDPSAIEEIGSKKGDTWIKIGSYNFEAIRMALLDHIHRTKAEQPEHVRHSYIRSISFEGGLLDGKTIDFSSQLNTLIGIRGSGKSAILESICYVLNFPDRNTRIDHEYKDRLVDYVLGSGGRIKLVTIDENGQEFEIFRTLNREPEVFVSGTEEPGIAIRKTAIHCPLFFGQKELSSRGEHFDQELLGKLLGDKLVPIRREIIEKKGKIVDIITILSKLNGLSDHIKTLEDTIRDCKFNLRKFKEFGIEDKFRGQTEFASDKRTIESMIKMCMDLREALLQVHGTMSETYNATSVTLSDQNSDIAEVLKPSYEVVSTSLKQIMELADRLEASRQNMEKVYGSFKEKEHEFSEQFAKIRRSIEKEIRSKGIDSVQLEDYPMLHEKIAKSENRLNLLEKQQQQEELLKTKLRRELHALAELWRKEFSIIETELGIINSTQGAIQISAEFEGDKDSYLQYLQLSFKGSGLMKNALSKLVENSKDFIAVYDDFDGACNSFPDASREKFRSSVQKQLGDLLTYQVPNSYSITYHGKELKQHSLGQRASALILFVLGQKGNDVIIIDQPEDDLDNQTIYEEVIKQIIALKPDMQFIFATHNANIPVLGDAEMVHTCSYVDTDGKTSIAVDSGSIDNQNTQKSIISIMEGGEVAFERRKEIYELWN